MNMNKLTWLAMAVLLSCAACTAKESEKAKESTEATQPKEATQEARKGNSIEEDFRRLDANKDGSISRDETQSVGTEVLRAHFDNFDTDKNGTLSLQEITAFVQAQQAQLERQRNEAFSRIDTDHDGGISKDEATKANDAFLISTFESIDDNKDGKLSLQELNVFSLQPPKDPGRTAQLPQAAPFFTTLDKDGSGTLSKDELKDQPEFFPNFDKIDTDHDGKITQQEILIYAHSGAAQSQTKADK